MDDSIDFQPYLNSICHDYAEWWKLYTLTDIEGKSVTNGNQNKRVAPFDFGLVMESINTGKPEALHQERTEKLERQPVLDGLRKSLAEAKHILLIGRPGSGKSTALARLLLEEAQHSLGNADANCKVPMLVQLRYYQTTVFDLIREFFKRHGLSLETHQVETLLSKNQLLLLIDGLNELSSESARQDIIKLRNYRHVPMIFTTRDLSLRGYFGIEKQWEMLPLTEPQMKEFIRSHLSPEQADAMWQQLQDRTRKFAETPLLLWMLCELFGQVEEIPRNLGEVFREFTTAYENSSSRRHEVAALKGDIHPLSDLRLWFPALKHLAYLMMQGETSVDSRTVISREEAEKELQALFCKEPYPHKTVRDCLDDLLKYHLLQIKTGNEIEFCHQLFQEYYAAEWLLQRLPKLTDEQLKYYFLNYLKWTEAICLMIGLQEITEIQAKKIIGLTLTVDLKLSAKLVESTRQNYLLKIDDFLEGSHFSLLVKCWLFGEAKLERKVSELIKIASCKKNQEIRNVAASALINISSKVDIPDVRDFLERQGFLQVIRFDGNNNHKLKIRDIQEIQKKHQQKMTSLEKLYYLSIGPVIADLIRNLWDICSSLTIITILRLLLEEWKIHFALIISKDVRH